MLFKLSLSNIRKSLRDYAVYFFTLIIGVSVFYLFNAIETQTLYLSVSQDTREMITLLNRILSGTSVFVAVVLGLLIVYASRFLMKRRNREFALYLTLGMSKSGISLLLLAETVMIGLGSLGVGLLIGIGLSQITSAFVASLFEADMTSYHFIVSTSAIVKTLIYFGIMYIVVMLFNTVMIGRRKLIDLMNSGKRGERLRMRNPAVCLIMFMISAAALAAAYYLVGWKTSGITQNDLLICIIVGCVSTYFIFRSVSGMLLRVFMSSKKLYFRGLNAFTFRQLSSKVNTMVFSLTLICLMLFVTICSLCGAFTIRNTLNENLVKYCPADYQLGLSCAFYDEKNDSVYYNKIDVEKLLGDAGIDTDEYFEKYCVVTVYADEKYDTREYFGEYSSQLPEASDMMMGVEMGGVIENTMTLSDFNALMRVFGLPEESLADDEYIELANVNTNIAQRNIPLENGHEITVFGKKLRPKYKECVERTIQLSNVPVNYGVTVIPDGAADPEKAREYYLTAKYNTSDKDRKLEYDNDLLSDEIYNKLWAAIEEHDNGMGIASKQFLNISKMELAQANIGTKALTTFLGLYIGVVFLITSGAILALRSLSDCADSAGRYEMLRKIGADEKDITGSLFAQTTLFFAFPLVLALVHTVFGMKFAFYFLNVLGATNILPSTLMTGGIVLLIFGGYFLITYLTSKLMIRTSHS